MTSQALISKIYCALLANQKRDVRVRVSSMCNHISYQCFGMQMRQKVQFGLVETFSLRLSAFLTQMH